MLQREQVSNGFKRIPLNLGDFPSTPPALLSEIKRARVGPALREGRPSYREQPVPLESRFHAKVLGFQYAGDSSKRWSFLGCSLPNLEI